MMVLPHNWLFETIKLLAQLGGALLIAWLAVRWALRRYKMEKSWEKRLQAYTDVILAIGEMQTVRLSWLQEIEEGFSWTAEHKAELSRRYQTSRIRLEEARAMASLLLPDETAGTIRWLFAALEQIPEDVSPHQIHSESVEKLAFAMESVLQQGRKSLGVLN
jgi:hypothetical protein